MEFMRLRNDRSVGTAEPPFPRHRSIRGATRRSEPASPTAMRSPPRSRCCIRQCLLEPWRSKACRSGRSPKLWDALPLGRSQGQNHVQIFVRLLVAENALADLEQSLKFDQRRHPVVSRRQKIGPANMPKAQRSKPRLIGDTEKIVALHESMNGAIFPPGTPTLRPRHQPSAPTVRRRNPNRSERRQPGGRRENATRQSQCPFEREMVGAREPPVVIPEKDCLAASNAIAPGQSDRQRLALQIDMDLEVSHRAGHRGGGARWTGLGRAALASTCPVGSLLISAREPNLRACRAPAELQRRSLYRSWRPPPRPFCKVERDVNALSATTNRWKRLGARRSRRTDGQAAALFRDLPGHAPGSTVSRPCNSTDVRFCTLRLCACDVQRLVCRVRPSDMAASGSGGPALKQSWSNARVHPTRLARPSLLLAFARQAPGHPRLRRGALAG